jgi:tRNA-dihydrouridine synthase C
MVQLLGGEPQHIAASARLAAELGAPGIDLNFGCPAKKVNGSDGGASLLREPRRLTEVIGEARAAVPSRLPVSAKIRLGWEDPDDVVEIVEAAEAGGASWITIHGRTKKQMYKPSADWGRIRRAADAVRVPVVANGDIFDRTSFERCRTVTGSTAFMLGRGAFRAPNLFRVLAGLDDELWPVARCTDLLQTFAARVLEDPRFSDPARVALNRLKGWVRALAETYPEMATLFETFKRCQDLDAGLVMIAQTS